MVSSNTETNITVSYDDADNTLDFVIGTLNQDTTGNAATATALETARTIHGVSFDGTANIDLSEVIADTVGAMVSSNTETNITVAYQDDDNTLDFTIGTLNQDTTGNAATATALETARTIGGVSFDGTANITPTTFTTATFSGDLNVDSGVLFADVSTNRVGINQTTPDVSLDLGANTDAVHVPVGTTAQRPGSPAAGYFRYNTTTSGFEGYTDSWGSIGGGGTAPILNTMTGDGSDTTLTLTSAPVNENATVVTIDGVLQHKDTYSISGTTLTFSEAPPTGTAVECITWVNTTVSSALLLEDADGDTKVQVEESSDEDKIRFDTGGTERMIIDSTGVGIGTTSPSAPLHILKSATGINVATDMLKLSSVDTNPAYYVGFQAQRDNSAGQGLNILTTNVSGTVSESMRIDTSGNVNVGGTTNFGLFTVTQSTDTNAGGIGVVDSGNAKSGRLWSNGTNIYLSSGATGTGNLVLNEGGGNVGIGTSSPNYNLTSYKAGANANYIQVANGSTGVNSANGTLFGVDASGNGAVTVQGAFAYITSVAGAERMRITSSGSVGINQSNPSSTYKLDVGGAIRSSGNSPSYTLREDDASSQTWLMASYGGTFAVRDTTVSGTAYPFQIEAATPTNTLFLDSSGNVGIGTSSPSSLGTGIPTIDLKGNSSSQSDRAGGIRFTRYDGTSGMAIYNADGASYIESHSTYPLLITTNGSERMRIDSSGNVGIKNNNPSDYNAAASDLVVGSGSGDAGMTIVGSTVSNGSIAFADGGTGATHTRGLITYDHSSDHMHFNTAGAERMRIDSSGNVLVGTTSGNFSAKFVVENTASYTFLSRRTGTGNEGHVVFQNGNGAVGTIFTNGSTTSYNTSSDARLKKVTGSARGLEVINELNPVAYNWKADGKVDEGLIAQEVLDIVPNAVSGSEEEMYQMDYSKLVVHLVKGMKEQQTQIDALQSEINELKNS
jgi:hypothetical protein